MPGSMFLPQHMAALDVEGLNYWWIFTYSTPGPTSRVYGRHVFSCQKPLLWYVKGTYQGDWISNDLITSKGSADKLLHPWQQSESGFTEIIERFTKTGQTILDPFLGSGTTGVVALRLGRRFIGIEIDKRTFRIARNRLAEVMV